MTNPQTFSVLDDMPDSPAGVVNQMNLETDIIASAITKTFVSMRTDGDILSILFDDDLTAGDETILHGDSTGPAGGLIAAHDNTATPDVTTKVVMADPEVTAVDAPEGSFIVWGSRIYRKTDNGSSTNVEELLTSGSGESGGSLLGLIEYTTDPVTPEAGDTWIRNTASVRRLVYYDGTEKHAVVLTEE